MGKGKINVSVENIFPLIKKFLYSDQEIFLRELVSNATDALTKLNHISSTGEIKGDTGDLGLEIKVNKKEKTLHVIDNGVGIDEKKISKLFEPYYTTKEKGTGLGLSIVKKIIEDHNGIIKIEKNKDMAGTSTHITFEN